MHTAIDTQLDNPEKLDFVRSVLTNLIGKTCWQVKRSYGRVLHFDLGVRVRSKPIIEREFGEWVIDTRGLSYRVTGFADEAVLFEHHAWDDCDDQPDDPEYYQLTGAFIDKIVGTTITDVQVNPQTLGLRIVFGNTLIFEILPTSQDELNIEEGDEPEDGEFWRVYRSLPPIESISVGAHRRMLYKKEQIDTDE